MERTNIQTNFENSKKKSSKKIDEKKPLLDTLAQLATTYVKPSPDVQKLNKLEQLPTNTRQTLARRAKAKYFTQSYTKQLAMLNSPLKKSYNNTYFGCSNVLFQEGKKITSNYCNNRWCVVCNRIRTAKLILGYKDELKKLPDLYFCTLTIPNVPANMLKKTIENMLKTFGIIIKTLNKRKKRAGDKNKLKGLRKIECTFNDVAITFHPHIHFLIEGYQNAVDFKNEWLKHYPDALPFLQNIKKADGEGTFIELFKYYTKIITNNVMYIEALDVIFRAMRGKRVYQPFGLKKCISEDIDAINAQITDLEEAEKIWMWEENDWVDYTGERLTNYVPDETMNELVNKNIKHIDIKIQQ
jgi:hypothetical protein